MAPNPATPRRATHLVTFCNVGIPRFALIDRDGVIAVHAADAAVLDRHVGGTVGAVVHQGRCYMALQSDPPAVAVFDRDWTQVGLFQPDEIKDIHGLAVHEGRLLIVSTATNQIVSYDLASGAVRPLWTEADALSDTAHINDLSVEGGRVVASRFGRRRPDGQRVGEVFDALTGETLVSGLREPHSAALADGMLHVLESPTGDLLMCRAGFSPRRLHGIVGYARGLAIGPTTIAIGKSGYRLKSRKGIGDARLAPLAATEASDAAQGMSGVFFVDRASGDAAFVDTSKLAVEVYAVVALPADPPPAPPRRRGAAAKGA